MNKKKNVPGKEKEQIKQQRQEKWQRQGRKTITTKQR